MEKQNDRLQHYGIYLEPTYKPQAFYENLRGDGIQHAYVQNLQNRSGDRPFMQQQHFAPPLPYMQGHQNIRPHDQRLQHGLLQQYGQASQYGQAGQHGQTMQYGQAGQHGQRMQYGQAGQHGQTMHYGQTHQHGQAPAGRPQGDGNFEAWGWQAQQSDPVPNASNRYMAGHQPNGQAVQRENDRASDYTI